MTDTPTRRVLLLHGFGGTNAELRYLRDMLTHRGFTVYSPLLPGHGAGRTALRDTSCATWLAAARAALEPYASAGVRVHVVGFSMGGLLAAHLAVHPVVEKLVFINTPVYFWNLRVILADTVHALRIRNYTRLRYYSQAVGRTSAKSGLDFLRILTCSKRRFASIHKPLLILQCQRDESAHYKSAAYIHRRVPGSILRYFPGGQHQFAEPENPTRAAMCAAVAKFLEV